MEKQWWKNYFQLTAAETKGSIVLLALILCLIGYNVYLQLQPPLSPETPDQELIAAFKKYKEEHSLTEYENSFSIEPENAVVGEAFPFDPNTIDSTTCLRLGLRSKTIHMLLNWRKKGKVFYKKEDLKPLYSLKEEEYDRLAPFITIASVASKQNFSFPKEETLPATIDLNITDSSTLVRLNGIGPTLAHKIISRRDALGGFLKHEQLMEVYRFSDTVFKMMKEKLVIKMEQVHKLSLNQSTFEQLKAHPYIGEKTAKNILLLREGLGKFEKVEQLRQVPLMNEEIYRKIAPYFVP
jgi:DNA uptake protein ComE-like DNA-binding protein